MLRNRKSWPLLPSGPELEINFESGLTKFAVDTRYHFILLKSQFPSFFADKRIKDCRVPDLHVCYTHTSAGKWQIERKDGRKERMLNEKGEGKCIDGFMSLFFCSIVGFHPVLEVTRWTFMRTKTKKKIKGRFYTRLQTSFFTGFCLKTRYNSLTVKV